MLKRNVIKIVLGIIIILSIGLVFIINNYEESITEEEQIEEYITETSTSNTTSKKTTERITSKLKIITTKKQEYLFVLEIPKINLKKGIYNINDKNNNVDKNIQILSSSNLPTDNNHNIILASHNGNTKVSYFKDLEMLSNDDLVYIYYKGIKYTYKVYKNEIVNKIGSIKITKKSNVSNLILISCKNGTNDKQIVYISKLINKEEY